MIGATVADCESSQAAWNAAVAVAGGGRLWQDGELRWSWQAHDGQLLLNFPRSIDVAAVQRGVETAREFGARIVGAWLSADVDAAGLEAVGFERGWEPWWMAAPLDALAAPEDPRISLAAEVPEYGPAGQRLLSLVRGDEARAWHAAARVDGRFAGRSWAFATGDVVGIYDMEVWPPFRRLGIGRALLRALCQVARASGAATSVLNATPEGERLYSAEGFKRLGNGITYWHHLE